MLCLNNYTHILAVKQRQMKAVRRRTWEPCFPFPCSSHWAHYCHLSPCLVANMFSKYPLGSPLCAFTLLLCRNIPSLFGHWTSSACHDTTAQSLQSNVRRFLSTILLTTSLQMIGGVNILCSTKELSMNSEKKGRNVQHMLHFWLVAFGFPHATH